MKQYRSIEIIFWIWPWKEKNRLNALLGLCSWFIMNTAFAYASFIMTSSNIFGNFFGVTGPLVGESTGHQWFPSHRPMTRSFDVSLNLRLYKQWCKQSRRRWFEAPLRSLWCHCNVKMEQLIYLTRAIAFRSSSFCPAVNFEWIYHFNVLGISYVSLKFGGLLYDTDMQTALGRFDWNLKYFFFKF